jgi:sulfate permease, SulP family
MSLALSSNPSAGPRRKRMPRVARLRPIALPAAASRHTLHPRWAPALRDGGIGTVITLALFVTLGTLALAPLGQGGAALGLASAFSSGFVSAGLWAAISRADIPSGAPSSATALILLALVLRLMTDPVLHGGPLAISLVLLGGVVVLMGAMQCAMAQLGMASVLRLVPQPVLAGFMNGVAVLIALSQMAPLLAIPAAVWRAQGLAALPTAHWAAPALGLGTAVAIWLLAWRRPRWPAGLLGMVAGVLVYQAVVAVWPAMRTELGPALGALPAGFPRLGFLALSGDIWPQVTAAASRHALALLTTAFLLAFVGALDSLLTLRALDQQINSRHNGRHELLTLGLANIAGGCVGALPMVCSRARMVVMLQRSSLGRRAALAAALSCLLIYVLGRPLLALLPQVVLAGVMLTIAWSLVDRWSRQLARNVVMGKRKDALRTSLVIVVTVCVLTVWLGPALGVAAGVLLSTVVFVGSMNRSVLRTRGHAGEQPSRRLYPAALEHGLQRLRSRIQVLELEGALFFGSAERVADEAAQLPPGTQFVVVDLRRVSTIDESGALMLQQLQARLEARGVELLLTGVVTGSMQQRRLLDFGSAPPPGVVRWFADVDHAVEAAELRLLDGEHPGMDPLGSPVALHDCALLRGLSDSQKAEVSARMTRYVLHPTETLFKEGDPGHGLYVLTSGSITIRTAQGQRFVSFTPGTMMGELGLVDGQTRSAHAQADRQSEVYLLSTTDFEALAKQDPALSNLLYRNITVHMSERLRAASMAWRSAAS